MKTRVIILLLSLSACYNDKEIILYPESNCTTPTTAAYGADVVPLLNQHCNNCHTGSFASGGVRLDSYAEVKKYVDNGRLMGSIQWQSGFSAMPKNGTKLSSCNIGKIQVWIASGAANN